MWPTHINLRLARGEVGRKELCAHNTAQENRENRKKCIRSAAGDKKLPNADADARRVADGAPAQNAFL